MKIELELNNIRFVISSKSMEGSITLFEEDYEQWEVNNEWFKRVVDTPIKGQPFRPLGSVLTYPAENSYRDYVAGCWMKNICTAEESFITFLKSENIDVKQPIFIKQIS